MLYKKISIYILFLFFIVNADNFSFSVKLIKNEISFNDFVNSFEKSNKAVGKFLSKSIEVNTDTIKKIGKGPIEFFAIIDTLFEKYGKREEKVFHLFRFFEDVVDGWIAEEYAGKVRKSCDKYPQQFKKAIIKQGKHSLILSNYLFDAGFDFKEGLFFKHKSPNNEKILKWAKFQNNIDIRFSKECQKNYSFQVVKVDTLNLNFFIVINSLLINNPFCIEILIRRIKRTHDFIDNSNRLSISFYTDKSCADYKTELPEDKIAKLDSTYIAVYNHKKRELKTYPLQPKKMNIYKLDI